MNLTVATCQFPASADIATNLKYVLQQMRTAQHRGAAVAHFPEACLSGYAGADVASTAELDWDLLRRSTEQVLDLASHLGLWVLLGSAHRLTPVLATLRIRTWSMQLDTQETLAGPSQSWETIVSIFRRGAGGAR